MLVLYHQFVPIVFIYHLHILSFPHISNAVRYVRCHFFLSVFFTPTRSVAPCCSCCFLRADHERFAWSEHVLYLQLVCMHMVHIGYYFNPWSRSYDCSSFQSMITPPTLCLLRPLLSTLVVLDGPMPSSARVPIVCFHLASQSRFMLHFGYYVTYFIFSIISAHQHEFLSRAVASITRPSCL